MTFTDLGLAEPILRALTEEGYTEPTPIQASAIPVVVSGRDLIGIAQTGTGKTAAFALPILNRLAASEGRPAPKSCRVLVLSPTRELSAQILESFRTYGRHLKRSATLAIGGVPMGKQVRALAGGVDILVATPGRLMDLLKNRAVTLDWVEVLVLDEADRMLDMGFIADIRKIVARLPKDRQTLFFSATMPPEIAALAGEMLSNPARVSVTPPASTVDRIAQRAIHVGRAGKPGLLAEVLGEAGVERAIVFTRTKHGADRVVRGLDAAGISADAIHGNKSQGQRERALAGFRSGKVRTLVATDIAARGIDVDGISHVINYDLPNLPESYVHRIGRTARAGKDGVAISFCSPDEVPFLRAIERAIRLQIPATASDGSAAPVAAAPIPTDAERPERREGRRRRRNGGEGRPGQGEPRQHRERQERQAEGRPGRDQPAQGRHGQERPPQGRPGGKRRPAHGNKQSQNRQGPTRHHGGDDIAAIGFLGKPRRQQGAAAV
jgi:ATP-dependent RNA helicase RhlE